MAKYQVLISKFFEIMSKMKFLIFKIIKIFKSDEIVKDKILIISRTLEL